MALIAAAGLLGLALPWAWSHGGRSSPQGRLLSASVALLVFLGIVGYLLDGLRAVRLGDEVREIESLLAEGEHARASRRARTLVRERRADPVVWALLAETRAQRGNTEGALAAVEQALSLSPDSQPLHSRRARILYEAGRVRAAFEPFLRGGAATGPNTMRLLLVADRPVAAVRWAERDLRRSEGPRRQAWARLRLGRALVLNGEHARARDLLRELSLPQDASASVRLEAAHLSGCLSLGEPVSSAPVEDVRRGTMHDLLEARRRALLHGERVHWKEQDGLWLPGISPFQLILDVDRKLHVACAGELQEAPRPTSRLPGR